MGYTHYWTTPTFFTPEFLSDVRLILAHAPCPLAREYNEPSEPPLVADDFIAFNGVGSDGHETFYLDSSNGFCKTEHKPYDIVVVAILALAAHHKICQPRSDGDSKNWQAGVVLASNATGLNIQIPDTVETAEERRLKRLDREITCRRLEKWANEQEWKK